jgi:hypothetical protein
MKKKIFIFIGLLVLVGVFVFHINNNPGSIVSSLLKKGEVKPGELVYRINLFGIIPAAEAVFSTEVIEDYNGQKVYHLSATAAPLKFCAKLFNGYAVLDSFVDMQSLNPVLFRQKVKAPGKENPSKEIFYDQKNNTMTMAGVERQVNPNTQDPLSMIFNLRHMDFDKTKDVELNLNTNQKNYTFKGIAKQEDLAIGKKVLRVVNVNAQIKRKGKDHYNQSEVGIVFLKDRQNIPILIKVFAKGFFISIKLIQIR